MNSQHSEFHLYVVVFLLWMKRSNRCKLCYLHPMEKQLQHFMCLLNSIFPSLPMEYTIGAKRRFIPNIGMPLHLPKPGSRYLPSEKLQWIHLRLSTRQKTFICTCSHFCRACCMWGMM